MSCTLLVGQGNGKGEGSVDCLARYKYVKEMEKVRGLWSVWDVIGRSWKWKR